MRRERAAVLLFLAVLLVLNWRATLLYFGVPWIFGQWGIVTINLLQHQGCDQGSDFDHSRNITGGFANWLFLNNGFHTAHHLRPAMHWSRLPEFHRENVEPRMCSGLNHRSLLACVWKQFFWRGKKIPLEKRESGEWEADLWAMCALVYLKQFIGRSDLTAFLNRHPEKRCLYRFVVAIAVYTKIKEPIATAFKLLSEVRRGSSGLLARSNLPAPIPG